MVQYGNDSLFPGQGMDFGSQDPKFPHVTIVTRKTHTVDEEDEGWLYIVVEADAIDEELAKRTIANAIGVSPGEIEFIQP
jgi:hypothetical protein